VSSKAPYGVARVLWLRSAWLCGACLLLLACAREPTKPQLPRYDLTFDGGSTILETPVDSPQVQVVMQDTADLYYITWSPDGRRVAFTREYWNGGTAYYRVLTYNMTDGTERVLTQGPDDSFEPAWSPDGAQIAYLSRPQGGGDATLRIISADGTNDHALGVVGYYVRPPRWSPDGTQLAATRNDLMVVIVDAATGLVVRAVASGMSPTWSPDGRHLAFVGSSITIIDVDGSNAKVTPFIGYELAWSPDGDWIAFNAIGEYVMSPGATDSTRIRELAPGGGEPAWRLRQ